MIVCDTHCDVLWMLAFDHKAQPVVTMESLIRGGISLQTLALFSGSDEYRNVSRMVGERELAAFRALKTQGWQQAFSPLEAEEGKVKTMLSIEGGEILEGSTERLDEYFEEGVRMMALTWNRENEIAYPAKSGERRGIKSEGWKMLRKMEELHVAADVSHLNEAGFYDLIDRHGQAPMASHSCCRRLCDHFRNLTDEQIRALIARGGWIGVNFYPAFLSEDGQADVVTLCNHIDHICQLGGERIVGLGSDFDGIETTPRGLESPAKVPAIFEELRRRNYDKKTIEAIAGGSFLEYYRRLGW